MSSEHEHGDAPHIVPTGTFVAIWLVLVACTMITVSVARIDTIAIQISSTGIGSLSTIVAIGIATFKATLVLLIFMHLKYDKPYIRWMFLITILFYGAALIMTFADTFPRDLGL